LALNQPGKQIFIPPGSCNCTIEDTGEERQ